MKALKRPGSELIQVTYSKQIISFFEMDASEVSKCWYIFSGRFLVCLYSWIGDIFSLMSCLHVQNRNHNSPIKPLFLSCSYFAKWLLLLSLITLFLNAPYIQFLCCLSFKCLEFRHCFSSLIVTFLVHICVSFRLNTLMRVSEFCFLS